MTTLYEITSNFIRLQAGLKQVDIIGSNLFFISENYKKSTGAFI